MLNTTYHLWEHTSGDTLVRTTQYSLPEDLHEHIERTCYFSRAHNFVLMCSFGSHSTYHHGKRLQN